MTFVSDASKIPSPITYELFSHGEGGNMVVVVRVRVALLKDPRPMTPLPDGARTFTVTIRFSSVMPARSLGPLHVFARRGGSECIVLRRD
jgi:hypothetical protein